VLVINQLGTTPSVLSAGQTPRQFAVNGRMVPNVHMQQGEIQLWRIVNTSHRSAAYFMAPEGGLEWRQLAQDGVQLANQNYRDSANTPFYLAPGNRVDLLVRAPMNDMSTGILIQEVTARAAVKPTPANPGPTDPKPGKPLMTVIVSGPPVMLYGVASQMEFLTAAPRQPPFLADITDEELIKNSYSQKTLEFNSTQNPGLPPVKHTINGIQFEDGKATVRVVLNTVEEWTVKNLTTTAPGPIDHPFHIHINPFQITEVFDPNEKLVDPATGQLEAVLVSGKTQSVPRYVTDQSQLTDPNNPFAHRQCFLDPNNEATWSVAGACGPQPPQSSLVWWDVFAIPSARVEGGAAIPGYFKMRSRFVDYPGVYVLHCHILIHEDRGMMFSVEVVGPRPILVQHH
jgi:FtsP/CotA-like multicopper oxidase with cupredoxin domain